MTSVAPQRKSSTAVQWYPHNATNDSAVLDMANSRQIALRVRLRNHFWLTDCKPMGAVTIDQILKKMKMIDARDEMAKEEVEEVLSGHFGFESTDSGFIIPDLIEDRGFAVTAAAIRKVRASSGGTAKADAARVKQELQGAPIQAPDKPPVRNLNLDHDF